MRLVDHFVSWGTREFSKDPWHRAAFQPLLFAALWLAAFRVAVNEGSPIRFEDLGGNWVYHLWLGINLFAPPLVLVSWYLIRRCRYWKRSTYAGMWLRLVGDTLMFGALLTFQVAGFMSQVAGYEEVVVRRHIVTACTVFVLMLIVRDIWTIVLTEKVANHLLKNGVRAAQELAEGPEHADAEPGGDNG